MSKTHVIESACLVVWLSLAVFFFTSLCRFQSSHFEGDRPLTMVESVYFMSQIITSVGYGDIVPSFFLGKVIVMLYIWFAVIIIGNLVSSCVEMINARLEDYLSHKAKMKFGDAVKRLESAGRRPTTLEFVDEKSVDYVPFLKSLAVYILMAFVGIVFFSSYPGEGKAWYQAMYMSVVTLSTVGFGSYTAETEIGKAFGAFWMLFGCVALGNMISKGIDLSITLKQHAAVDHEKDQKKWVDLCERMDTDKSGTISDLEFLKIGLVYAGFASEHEVEQVHRFFLQINHSTNKPARTPVPTRKLKQLMAPPDVPVSGLAA